MVQHTTTPSANRTVVDVCLDKQYDTHLLNLIHTNHVVFMGITDD